MHRSLPRPIALVLAALALSFTSSAAAKEEGETKEAPAAHLRWARTYAAAMAEAKARGCVVFATFHSDG